MTKIKLRAVRHGDAGARIKAGAARTPSRASSPAQWQKLLDHYLLRARELVAAGDLIEAENCFQHAEHYFRLVRGA